MNSTETLAHLSTQPRWWQVMAMWTPRRWITAAVVATVTVVAIGVPTALIPNGFFARMIPAPWWSWPALIVTAMLAGLVTATYVAPPAGMSASGSAANKGWLASALTFFAVGCPICNKLVLLALGTAGALTWFEPVQPFIQAGAIGLLGWALWQRLRGEVACRALPKSKSGTHP